MKTAALYAILTLNPEKTAYTEMIGTILHDDAKAVLKAALRSWTDVKAIHTADAERIHVLHWSDPTVRDVYDHYNKNPDISYEAFLDTEIWAQKEVSYRQGVEAGEAKLQKARKKGRALLRALKASGATLTNGMSVEVVTDDRPEIPAAPVAAPTAPAPAPRKPFPAPVKSAKAAPAPAVETPAQKIRAKGVAARGRITAKAEQRAGQRRKQA